MDHEILPPASSGGVIRHQWLSSFLTDTLQSAAFGGSISTPQRLLCGVPQRSVLGPLLFALYSVDVFRLQLSMKSVSMPMPATYRLTLAVLRLSRVLLPVASWHVLLIQKWVSSNQLECWKDLIHLARHKSATGEGRHVASAT